MNTLDFNSNEWSLIIDGLNYLALDAINYGVEGNIYAMIKEQDIKLLLNKIHKKLENEE